MTDNQLKAFINEVEKTADLGKRLETSHLDLLQVSNQAGYTITDKDTKVLLAEIKHINQEDNINMPPLVVLIMAYLNILFPDYEKKVDVKSQ